MREKTRKYEVTYEYNYPDGSSQTTKTMMNREVLVGTTSKSRPFRQFNKCIHTKVITPAYGLSVVRSDGEYYELFKGYGDAVHCNEAVSLVMQNLSRFVKFSELDFQKNNNFELIPFLFDLDSTVAMFSKKFVTQLSYGSINWGLLPFISDVKSLYATMADVFQGRFDAALGNTKRIEKAFPVVAGTPRSKFSGTLYLQGSLSTGKPDFKGNLGILLDELGIHPDLKTVWDVIPLSFVVDYFIPVGDYLESVHPRGWFKPQYSFTGTCTLKGLWEFSPAQSSDFFSTTRIKGKYYNRGFSFSNLPPTYEPKVPEWEAPSSQELFNTAYLALASRR